MKSSIVLVDVGNTSISFALACGERLSRRSLLASRGLSRQAVSESLARLVCGRHIHDSILCSVVPAMNPLWLRELSSLIGRKPLLVHHRLNLGIGISLPDPVAAGADRLANACAVSYWYGTPAIVVDFGTALTFDVVSKDRKYIGGVIAPGLPFMTDYFAERTALLPRLSWKQRGGVIRPASRVPRGLALGRNTAEAMLVGAGTGYLGMVREILKRLRAHLGSSRIRLCATGGYAEWILRGSDLDIPIDPDLTLRGLNRIYGLNRDAR